MSGIKGKFIKLDKIFNVLELTPDIPFVALNLNSSGEPKIKVYNKLMEEVSDKEFKMWILNEKKKLNQMSYKKVNPQRSKHIIL